ncbi:hypothetical protein K504DRAFT_377608, partial [Pleomassaria siparia CBS 279.74]
LTPPLLYLIGGDFNVRHKVFKLGSISAYRGTELARHILDLTFSNIPFTITIVREDLYYSSNYSILVIIILVRGLAILD